MTKKFDAKTAAKTYVPTFPLTSALFLLFTYLKLTGTITWSWWLVTAPLWGPLAFLLAVLVVGLIGIVIWVVFDEKVVKKKK